MHSADIQDVEDIRQVPAAQVNSQIGQILDDAQHRGTATAITRRGTPAAIVVPPGWYAAAQAALREVLPDTPGGES